MIDIRKSHEIKIKTEVKPIPNAGPLAFVAKKKKPKVVVKDSNLDAIDDDFTSEETDLMYQSYEFFQETFLKV